MGVTHTLVTTARGLLMPSQRLMLMLITGTTAMEATDMEATEVTTATHMAVATTTARDPLMLSPLCSLEPAVLCPPPLLSSTTPQSSLPSPTLPIPWPMLATPPTPWPTMVFPSWLPLSLLLLLITASLTGVDFVLFLCLVPAIRALLL